MGILLQHNYSVLVKVGTESGFISQKVFTGDTVYAFVPVFQFNVIIIIAFQSLDMITFIIVICLCFDICHTGTAVMQVGRILPPSFLFCQRNCFDPREIIPPATRQTIYVMSLVTDNLRSLGVFLIMLFSIKRHPFPSSALFIFYQQVFQRIFMVFQNGGVHDNASLRAV